MVKYGPHISKLLVNCPQLTLITASISLSMSSTKFFLTLKMFFLLVSSHPNRYQISQVYSESRNSRPTLSFLGRHMKNSANMIQARQISLAHNNISGRFSQAKLQGIEEHVHSMPSSEYTPIMH